MIWFTLALFVVSFFLSVLLAPEPDVENARRQGLGDVRFPKADAGSPQVYVFGRVRLQSPNVIWYGDFRSEAVKEKIKTGAFSSKKVTVGYKYYLGLQLNLCLGPDVTLRRVWVENDILYNNALGIQDATVPINAPNFFGGDKQGGGIVGNMTFTSGGFSQTQNAYLASQLGSNVPAYVGVSYVLFEGAYIGTNPQLRKMSFLVDRYPDNLGLGGSRIIGDDLNPMEVLYSALTEEWGGLGVDPATLDTASFIAAAATLATENHGMSVAFQASTRGKSIISFILRQVDGIMYQDPTTGQMVVSLIREDYTVGSLPVFDETNIESIRDWSRTSWEETYNQVRVTYTDPLRNYETSTAMAQDQANISQTNKLRSASLSFPGITVGATAINAAYRELSALSVPLFRATVNFNRKATVLRPGSPFVLNWPDFPGVTGRVFRIQNFDMGELSDGRIVAPILEDKFAASDALFAIPEDTLWSPIDRTAVDVTEFELFEAPYFFMQNIDDLDPTAFPDSSWLWCLARRPQFMTFFDMIVSDDSFSNDVVAELSQATFAASARLSFNILEQVGRNSGDIPTGVKIYDLDPLGGDFLELRTALEVRDGFNLFMIDQEIFGYENRINNGDGTWNLTNVYRGLLDTEYQDHAADAPVYFMTDIDLLSLNARPDTDVLSVKLLTYSDVDALNLADAALIPQTNDQRYDRPAPPDFLSVEGANEPIEIIGKTSLAAVWRSRNRTDPTIAFYDDTSDAAEGGTTYNVRLFIDGQLIEEVLGHGSLSYTFTGTNVEGWGGAIVRVESVLGGLISHTYEENRFFYANYQNQGSEKVVNGRFEASLGAEWSTDSGTWARVTTSYPMYAAYDEINPSDNDHLESSGVTNEIHQDIAIGGDSGRAALLRLYKTGPTTSDGGQVIVELRDGVPNVLDSVATPVLNPAVPNEWERVEIPMSLRTDATTVRVRLLAAGDSSWDMVSLKANTAAITDAVQYDTLGSVGTVLGAWGLRRMVSGYSGPLVRVRDTFDNSQFDIGFDSNGNLEPFYSRFEPRVLVWYDQSGNGVDLEDFSTNDPRLTHFLTETGRPSIEFDVANMVLRDPAQGASRPYMVARPNFSIVCGPQDVAANAILAMICEDPLVSPFYPAGLNCSSGGLWYSGLNGPNNFFSGAHGSVKGDGQNVFFLDYQNGDVYHQDDITATDTFTPTDIAYTSQSRFFIGGGPGGANDWTGGNIHEVCIFSGTLNNTDRATMMTSLKDYWFNL